MLPDSSLTTAQQCPKQSITGKTSAYDDRQLAAEPWHFCHAKAGLLYVSKYMASRLGYNSGCTVNVESRHQSLGMQETEMTYVTLPRVVTCSLRSMEKWRTVQHVQLPLHGRNTFAAVSRQQSNPLNECARDTQCGVVQHNTNATSQWHCMVRFAADGVATNLSLVSTTKKTRL